jgi:molecular chaperone IbpA
VIDFGSHCDTDTLLNGGRMDREFRLTSKNVKDFLERDWFGGDSLLEQPKNRGLPNLDATNFPRYNLVSSENGLMRIELAVAGYAEADLKLKLENDILTVSGAKSESTDDLNDKYHYKGITSKSFTKAFRVKHNVQIDEAKLKDGILTIFFSPKVVNETNGISIPINGAAKKPQLLQEQPREGMEIPF